MSPYTLLYNFKIFSRDILAPLFSILMVIAIVITIIWFINCMSYIYLPIWRHIIDSYDKIGIANIPEELKENPDEFNFSLVSCYFKYFIIVIISIGVCSLIFNLIANLSF